MKKEKEVWRFIDSGDCSPSFNMALDEVLLQWHSEGKIPPTIRFYGWNPATLSIGYFQKVGREIDMDSVKNMILDLSAVQLVGVVSFMNMS